MRLMIMGGSMFLLSDALSCTGDSIMPDFPPYCNPANPYYPLSLPPSYALTSKIDDYGKAQYHSYMSNGTNFSEWLKALAGDDTQKVIAKKAGLVESTLSRQLSRGTFRPEMVIALCRGYDRSPVTGLIETGYLQEWETEDVGIPYALQKATNKQILDEILRRSDPEAAYLFGDPTGEAVDYDPQDTNVIDLPEPPPHVTVISDDEAAAAIREAHQLRGAAHPATTELTEPETP